MSSRPEQPAEITGRGYLFIIAAPSGGGKTSLVKALLNHDPRLALSVSHTTRQPRPGEVDTEHYHFISTAKFESMVSNGDFIEHARVFDNYYGTSRQLVSQQLGQNRDVILDIDWQGARQVRTVYPGCCTIFIIPPSLEILHKRLTRRAQDSNNVIQRRMRDARAEISHWAEFDHLVVNDNFETTLKELTAIIKDHRMQRTHKTDRRHQHLAQRLGSS